MPASAKPACTAAPTCPLCANAANRVVWQSNAWRVLHADSPTEADFPAFYRLVCNTHYAEWSDLPEELQREGMALLTCIESTMRTHFAPHKINLASLGNVVPHLHWHIIARYAWDTHFPAPVWSLPQRAADTEQIAALRKRLPEFETALRQALRQWVDAPK